MEGESRQELERWAGALARSEIAELRSPARRPDGPTDSMAFRG